MKIKLFIFSLILLLCGCYNYNELNDLAITTAIGIDKTENGYLISLQVINTQKSSDNSNSKNDATKFTIYKAEGKTIGEAVKKISYICPKKIYLSHLEILIYGEDEAKFGIDKTIDFLLRNIYVRNDFYVFIAKNSKAFEILEIITPIEDLNAKNIVNILKETKNNLSETVDVSFEDIANNYLNNNNEIIIPSIEIIGGKNGENTDNIKNTNPFTYLKISNTSIFKNNKLIGYISNSETRGYNILTNNAKQCLYQYKDKTGYIETLIYNFKTNIEAKENLQIDININAEGILTEITSSIDISNNNNIKKISNHIEKLIKKDIEKVIKTAIKYETDFLGILNIYYKNNNNYYQTIKDNWYKSNFKRIKPNINVNINLTHKGNTLKGASNE